MKKITLLIATFMCLGLFTLEAQTPPPPPPVPSCGGAPAFGSTCQTSCVVCQDFTPYMGDNRGADGGTFPNNSCGGQDVFPHRVQWVGFISGGTNIAFTIDISNCDDDQGLQIGLFSTINCSGFNELGFCSNGGNSNTSISLDIPTIPGAVYFLVLDGFADDQCDFTITRTDGSIIGPTIDDAPMIDIPNPVCPGGIYPVSASEVAGAGFYEWTVDGNVVSFEQTVNIEIPEDYTSGDEIVVCVTPSNPCATGPVSCETINVEEDPVEILPPVDLCEDDGPFEYNGEIYTSSQLISERVQDPSGCFRREEFELTFRPMYEEEMMMFEWCQGSVGQDPPVYGGQTLTIPGEGEIRLQSVYGCDSILPYYLEVHEVAYREVDAVICEGDYYEVAGRIFDTEDWYEFTNIGADPETGCDSLWVVRLVVEEQPGLDGRDSVQICAGDSYSFSDEQDNFFSFNMAGDYPVNYKTLGGCDSFLVLTVEVLDPRSTIDTVLCEGESVRVGNRNYDVSDTLDIRLQSSSGCDSIVTLMLEVVPTQYTVIDTTICGNESYLFDGIPRNTSDTYTATFQSPQSGCDSIVTLNLVVADTFRTYLTETLCYGETYTLGTTTYSNSGVYTEVFQSIEGCDSTVVLDLTIRDSVGTTINEAICAGDVFNYEGNNYDATGNYNIVLQDQHGCDSNILLNLLVREQAITNIDTSYCEGEALTVADTVLNSPGTYRLTRTDQFSCDSIVVLTVTELPVKDTTFDAGICPGVFYPVGDTLIGNPGTYRVVTTSSNGCDSIINITLTQSDTIRNEYSQTICEGESFTFAGQVYTETGVYRSQGQDALGCDSIATLILTVNSTLRVSVYDTICMGESRDFGGSSYSTSGSYQVTHTATSTMCDSVVTLELTVLPVSMTNLNPEICAGETYQVGTSTYDESGTYRDTLVAANGCDSIIVTELTVKPVFNNNLVVSICEEESFTMAGQTYDQTGFYRDTIPASNGCDSILTLDLTVRPILRTNLIESICEGETFNVGSSTYTSTGRYVDTLLGANMCDSIISLDLTVYPVYRDTINASICDRGRYTVGDTSYNQAGVHTTPLTSVNGCDSIVVLQLMITNRYETTLNPVICEGESFSVGSSVYTMTGNFQDDFIAEDLCDSVVFTNLTVLPILRETIDIEICEGEVYEFAGQMYGESGIYVDTATAVQTDCDSITTLNLTVHPTYEVPLEMTICIGETYQLGDQILSTTGIYRDTFPTIENCDSIVVLDLTVTPRIVNPISRVICSDENVTIGSSIYNQTGIYQDTFISNVTNCDSIVVLDLLVNPIKNTTLEEVICSGTDYTVGNMAFNTTGVYNVTLQTSEGCDSIVTLNLQVDTIKNFLIEAICDNESFEVGDTSLETTGNYLLNVPTAQGCDSLVYIDLTVHETYAITLEEDICNDETFTVGDQEFSTPGSYVVNLRSEAGCDSIVTLNLDTHPCSLEATVSTSPTTCADVEDGQLSFTLLVGSPPYVYEYFLQNSELSGSDSISENNQPVVINDLPAGQYTINVYDAYGIMITLFGEIESPSPIVLALAVEDYNGNYQVSCYGDADGSIEALVSGGVGNYQYEWSNGATTSSLSGLPAGRYEVSVSDGNSCLAIAAADINEPDPLTARVEAINPACFGDVQGRIEVSNITGGVGPYMYSLNGKPFGQNPIFPALEPGDYEVVIQDASGCTYNDVVVVSPAQELTVEITGEVDINLGEETQLNVRTSYPVETYEWDIDSTLSCQDCKDPIVSGIETKPYVVTVTDAQGCTASARILVVVRKDLDIYIPNIFSPNGDGINDHFTVYSDTEVDVINFMRIYNRWGEKLYERRNLKPNDSEAFWDGNHRGEPMNTGVYVYVLEVTFLDGSTKILTGDVVLKK